MTAVKLQIIKLKLLNVCLMRYFTIDCYYIDIIMLVWYSMELPV